MPNHKRAIHTFLLLLFITMLSACVSQNSLLANNIKGEQRSEQNRVRDTARHPLQTLAFFEVKPASLNIMMPFALLNLAHRLSGHSVKTIVSTQY